MRHNFQAAVREKRRFKRKKRNGLALPSQSLIYSLSMSLVVTQKRRRSAKTKSLTKLQRNYLRKKKMLDSSKGGKRPRQGSETSMQILYWRNTVLANPRLTLNLNLKMMAYQLEMPDPKFSSNKINN